MYRVAISNGTFAVTGNGYLDFNSAASEAETATLDCDSLMILNQSITVSNYVARYAGTDTSGHGASAIHVLSSFKPLKAVVKIVTPCLFASIKNLTHEIFGTTSPCISFY